MAFHLIKKDEEDEKKKEEGGSPSFDSWNKYLDNLYESETGARVPSLADRFRENAARFGQNAQARQQGTSQAETAAPTVGGKAQAQNGQAYDFGNSYLNRAFQTNLDKARNWLVTNLGGKNLLEDIKNVTENLYHNALQAAQLNWGREKNKDPLGAAEKLMDKEMDALRAKYETEGLDAAGIRELMEKAGFQDRFQVQNANRQRVIDQAGRETGTGDAWRRAFKDAQADERTIAPRMGQAGGETAQEGVKGIGEWSGSREKLGEYMRENYQRGNVDLLTRPQVETDDGYMTLDSHSYYAGSGFGDDSSGDYYKDVIIHVTPILRDGTVLTDEELEDYVHDLIESGDIEAADRNGLRLLTWLQDVNGDMDASKADADAFDFDLHKLQESYYGDQNGQEMDAARALLDENRPVGETLQNLARLYESSFAQMNDNPAMEKLYDTLSDETAARLDELMDAVRYGEQIDPMSATELLEDMRNELGVQDRLESAAAPVISQEPEGWDWQLELLERREAAANAEAAAAARPMPEKRMTWEEADRYMEGQSPVYSVVRDNPGKAEEIAGLFENAAALVQKARQNGMDGLTDAEIDVYSALMNGASALGTYDPGADDSETAAQFNQLGQEYARQVREMGGLFTGYSPTEYQSQLWDAYIHTPEGAQYYLEQSKGTDLEVEAQRNQYFVQAAKDEADMQTREDFALLGQMDPQYLDSALYARVNGQAQTNKDTGVYPMPMTPNGLIMPQSGNLGDDLMVDGMTEEQKATFNAFWKEYGPQRAAEYLETLQYELGQKMNAQFGKAAYEYSQGAPVTGSLMTVPASLLSGLGYVDARLQDFRNMVSGLVGGDYKPVNYDSQWQIPGTISEQGRQAVQDKVDWNVDVFGRQVDVFDFLYGTLMSGLDSAGSGVMGGGAWGGAAMIGGGAAKHTQDELVARGANERQVAVGSTLAGVFETLFEHVTLGKLYDEAAHLGKRSAAETVKNVLAMAGINFSEEFNTELANIAVDTMLMGDKAEYKQEYDYLISMGMTPEEANQRIASDIAFRAVEEGVGGALMGGVMGGGANLTSDIRTGSYNKATGGLMNTNTKQNLAELAKNSSDKAVQKAGAKFDPLRSSDKQAGKLLQQVMKDLPQQMRSSLQSQIAESVARQAAAAMAGMDEKTRAAAASRQAAQLLNQETESRARDAAERLSAMDGETLQALAKAETGQNLTDRERRLVQRYLQDQQAAEAIGKMVSGQELTPEEARALAASERGMALVRNMMAEDYAETQRQDQQAQEQAQEAREEAQDEEWDELPTAEGDRRAEAEAKAREQTEQAEAHRRRIAQIEQDLANERAAEEKAREQTEQAEARRQRIAQIEQDLANERAAEEKAREQTEQAEARRQRIAELEEKERQRAEREKALRKGAKDSKQRSGLEYQNELRQLREEKKANMAQLQQERSNEQAARDAVNEQNEQAEARRQRIAQLEQNLANERAAQARMEEEAQAAVNGQNAQAEERAARIAQLEQELANERAAQARMEEEARAAVKDQNAQAEARKEREKELAPVPVKVKGAEGESTEHQATFRQREDGLVAVLEDGAEVDAGDLDMNEADAAVVDAAESLEDEAAANGMIADLSGTQDAEKARSMAGAWLEAYRQGRDGKKFDYQALLREGLAEETARRAWENGQRAHQDARDKQTQAVRDAAKQDGFRALGDAQVGDTGLFYNDVDKPVTKAQKTQLQLVDLYARQNGWRVIVHKTLGNQNGVYQKGSNIINVSLDAEGGYLTRVVSHEGYHYIMDHDAKAGRQIMGFVLDTLKNKGMDLDARRQEVMDTYRDEADQELTPEEADEEIAADGLLDVIGTEDNLKALAKAQNQGEEKNTSLIQRIRDWLARTAQRLKNLMNRFAENSQEAALLKDDADYIAQVRNMYETALKNLGQNKQQAQAGLYQGVKSDPAVQTYAQDMDAAVTPEDAQAALNGLLWDAYTRTQTSWITAHPDLYEQGFQIFSDVLRKFGIGEANSLYVALTAREMDTPQGEAENQLLSYAARQLAKQGEQAGAADQAARTNGSTEENTRYSVRRDTEADARQTAAGVRADAELYAQVMSDEDIRAAVEALGKVLDSVRHISGTMAVAGKWQERLDEFASQVITETESKISKQKLKNEMARLFQLLDDGKTGTPEALMFARDIAREVLEKAPGTLMEQDETTRDILNTLKNRPFFLTQDQRSEIRGTYGDVQTYRRKNFGKLRIRAEGNSMASLADVWAEDLAPRLPSVFSEDASPNDMPGILDAWLENAGKKRYTGEFGANIQQYSTSLGLEMLGQYLDAPWTNERTDRLKEAFNRNAAAIKDYYQKRYEERINKTRERKEQTDRKRQLRDRIARDVKDINKLNVAPSDNRHVPEEMRRAALEAVRPFLRNTSVFSQAALDRLGRMYSALQEQESQAGGFDADILASIQAMAEKMEGKRLSDLTEQELNDISEVVGNLHKMILRGNEAFVNGRKTTIDALSGQYKEDMRAMQARDGKFWAGMRQFSYKMETPVYFADRVGGVTKAMIGDLFKGSYDWAFVQRDSKRFMQEQIDKYHVNDWYHDKNHLRFQTRAGDMIELDRAHALSLYALWNRERTNVLQDACHLRVGGFLYENGASYEGVDTKKPHTITESDMQMVRGYLTEEQMAFADEMVRYLSEDMSALGNEVSMALYGYEKFKEKYYFPYASGGDYLNVNLTDNGERVTQPKNKGMTKALRRNAATPVTLGDFSEVWGNHVNDMGIYYGFAQAMDTMNRVLNDKTSADVRTDPNTGEILSVAVAESNWALMRKAIGDEGVNYFKTLARDIAGGVRADERGAMAKGLSMFKKASVAANLSVTMQQPTAIARAMMMVNPKYLLMANPANIGKSIRQMEQYSGVAVIKDMGRFDTGTGKGAVAWLTDGITPESKGRQVLDVIDNVSGKGAEMADKWTWGLLWDAISKETQHTRTDLAAGTEEFYQAVAERFNDVVNHTQVYDSTLSRSQWMRGTSTMDKMVTSFMAEPTLSFNMLMDTVTRFNQDGMGAKKVARAAATFAANAFLTALAKSIMQATRKKKEEGKTWLEKYIAAVTANFVDDVSPFGIAGMIPVARDAISIFEGYDVERSDMDAIVQLKKGYDTLKKYIDGKSTLEDMLQGTLGPIANLFGIPLKNVWRDVEGIVNQFTGGSRPIAETSGRDIKYSVLDELKLGPISLWDSGNAAYYERMEQALIRGDQAKYDELYGYLTETKQVKETTVATGIKKEILDSAVRGLVSEEKAMEVLTQVLGMDEKKAFQALDKALQEAEAKAEEDEEFSYKVYGSLLEEAKKGGDIAGETKRLMEHGYTEKDVLSEVKSGIKEWFVNGEIDRTTAEKRLKQYIPTLTDNDVYWQLEEWEANKRGNKDAKKYDAYIAAMDTGEKLKDETKRYLDHGVKESTLASTITEHFKPLYIAAYERGDKTAMAEIQARALTAYEMLGKKRSDKMKDIEGWIKQYEKSK